MSGGSIAMLFVALLVVLPVLLLAVPVRLRARAVRDGTWTWELDLHWLFGLVRLRRSSLAPRRNPDQQGTESSPAPAKPRTGRRQDVAALLLDPQVWSRGAGTLRSVLRGLTCRLDGRLQLGLEDPADTGRLFGLLQPLLHVARNVLPGNLKLDVAPDFARTGIAGHASAALRLVPLRALAPLVAFGLWLAVYRWRRRT